MRAKATHAKHTRTRTLTILNDCGFVVRECVCACVCEFVPKTAKSTRASSRSHTVHIARDSTTRAALGQQFNSRSQSQPQQQQQQHE